MTKKLLIAAAILILLFSLFFVWSSRSILDSSQYLLLKDYGHPELTEKDTFTIITYNFGYASGMENNLAVKPDEAFYQENLSKAIRLLSNHAADFVAFQEIDFGASRSFFQQQLDSIGYQAGYAFGSQATNWDKRYLPFPYWPPSVHYGQMHSGQAILSKYPFARHMREVLPKPEKNPSWYNAFYIDRLIHTVQVKLGNRSVFLVNVHLEAFDADSRASQTVRALQVADSLHEIAPVIFLGDFNAEAPFTPDPRYDTVALVPVFGSDNFMWGLDQSVFLRQSELFNTFSSENPEKKIDHIFVSRGKIVPLKYEVLTEFGQISDHLPVKMTFVLTKK